MPPLVSVVMPSFNSSRFIEKAILSVVDIQGVDDVELVVVDDWSTDNTWEIISEMNKKYQNIKMVRNVCKKGPAGGRNTGLMNSSGKYIGFLDADDEWLPGHLEKSIGYCEKYDLDGVFNDFSVFDFETGNHMYNWFDEKSYFKTMKFRHIDSCIYVPDVDMVESLLQESFIHIQSMIARSSTLESLMFNDDLYVVDDFDFCVRMCMIDGFSIAYTGDVTGVYNRHCNCITVSNVDSNVIYFENHIKLFKMYLEDAAFQGYSALLRERLAHAYLEHAYWMRRKGEVGAAVRSVMGAVKCDVSLGAMRELCKVGAWSLSRVLRRGVG